MNDHKRTARNLWIWSAGLLLPGVAAYLGGFAGLDESVAAELASVATLLVLTSAAAAIGAISNGSHSINSGKRTVLIWSSATVILAIALAVIVWSLMRTSVNAQCDSPYEGAGTGCGLMYAFMAMGFGALVAIAAIIAWLVAVIAGLITAIQVRAPWWFVAILTTLLGALAVVVWELLVLQRPQLERYAPTEPVQGWLIPLAPLMVSTLLLLFSLSGARHPKQS